MPFVSSLTLENVKCFPDKVRIDLAPPEQTSGGCNIILGANGTGKTSILRCIALGLCDENRAASLVAELLGEFIRHGSDTAKVELELVDGRNTSKVELTFSKAEDDESEVLQQRVLPGGGLRRNAIFACGYGVAFGTFGNNVYSGYRLVDAVYTLFNYQERLQNPETAIRRISDHSRIPLGELTAVMDRILGLEEGSVRLTSSGMEIRGPWGYFAPIGAIGDGYAAMLAWLCDFFGWLFLGKRRLTREAIRGIVLFDEIERHLHPSWQRRVVPRLVREFPNVQFIVTTHAPLVAIGAASIDQSVTKLTLLQYNDRGDGVEVKSALRPPDRQRADQVLTSPLFGLPWTTSDKLVHDIEEYARLKRLEAPDDGISTKIESLRSTIARVLSEHETPLQRNVADLIRGTYHELWFNRDQNSEPLDFELRRQILEILDS